MVTSSCGCLEAPLLPFEADLLSDFSKSLVSEHQNNGYLQLECQQQPHHHGFLEQV